MRNRASLLVLALFVAAPASTETTVYRVLSEESHFTVYVGKAGLFSAFGGHDHLIEVREFQGTVRWDADAPESSEFVLEVKAASLTVADEEVSEEERAQIQADMEAKALVLTNYPKIVFESREVALLGSEDGTQSLNVTGSLDLRGVRKSIEVPVTLSVSDGRLTASGEVTLPSEKWGVPQISAVGGTIKTDEELELAFELVAARE